MNTGSPVVDAITKMRFVGNIIPHTWYQEIRIERTLPDKQEKRSYPDLNAILILAEIVFLYRAKDEVDEQIGKQVVFVKRFDADKLQRSVASFVNKFGLSDKQVREALHRLEKAGLITIELRTVRKGDKVIANNAMFLEPIPDRIEEISFPKKATPLSPGVDTPREVDSPLSLEGDTPLVVDNLPTPGYRPSPPRGIDKYIEGLQEPYTEPIHIYGAVPEMHSPESEETEPVQARDSSRTPPPSPSPSAWTTEDLDELKRFVAEHYPNTGPNGEYRPGMQALNLLVTVPLDRVGDFKVAVKNYAQVAQQLQPIKVRGLTKFLENNFWAGHIKRQSSVTRSSTGSPAARDINGEADAVSHKIKMQNVYIPAFDKSLLQEEAS